MSVRERERERVRRSSSISPVRKFVVVDVVVAKQEKTHSKKICYDVKTLFKIHLLNWFSSCENQRNLLLFSSASHFDWF